MSHSELQTRLPTRLPNLNVVGGCCGTSHRHVAEICAAVTA
jgi:methionine synthase I (cobalamin-dependent)